MERVVGADFRIERSLSEGGMASVFVAEQISTGKKRALKLMKTEVARDARFRERFVLEAKVGARIASEHVVEVLGAGIDAGAPWLAMELLDGEDLAILVANRGPRAARRNAGDVSGSSGTRSEGRMRPASFIGT